MRLKNKSSGSRPDFIIKKKLVKSKRLIRARTSFLNSNIVKSRRSQEELVGFGIIIVVVAVIALVFLSIGLRKQPEMKNSLEVSDFLYSSFEYSIECSSQVENLDDLILACVKGQSCEEESSCEILRNTYKDMIEKSIRLEEESRYKAYNFKIISDNETVLFLESGNKTGSLIGSRVHIPTRESINVSLALYY